MRIKNSPLLATALMMVGATRERRLAGQSRQRAPLNGNWKLVVLPFGEDEFAIVKLGEKDGKTTATMADAQRMLGLNSVKAARAKRRRAHADADRVWRRYDVQGNTRQGRPLTQASSWERSTSGARPYPARLEETKNQGRRAQARSAGRQVLKRS